jgi:hypothetical protein
MQSLFSVYQFCIEEGKLFAVSEELKILNFFPITLVVILSVLLLLNVYAH